MVALGQAGMSSGLLVSRGFPIPDHAQIIGGPSGISGLVSLDQILDLLYLGPELSYQRIEVGVVASGPNAGTGWIRVGEEPAGSDNPAWDAGGIDPFSVPKRRIGTAGYLVRPDSGQTIPWELTDAGKLLIDGSLAKIEFPVVNAVAVAGLVVVLYDPEANPRSWGTFANLVAFDHEGRQVWQAETATTSTGDCFHEILSPGPLVAYSWQGYECQIDPDTGRIVARTFTH